MLLLLLMKYRKVLSSTVGPQGQRLNHLLQGSCTDGKDSGQDSEPDQLDESFTVLNCEPTSYRTKTIFTSESSFPSLLE